jgi:hypothetical protein
MQNTNQLPTMRQLVLGDMLNNFCEALINNTPVDKSAINIMFDEEDIVAYELYCLIDIQSVIFETKGHYDLRTFVSVGLNKSSIGIFTEKSYDSILERIFGGEKLNIKAGDNYIKRSILNAVYIDEDKIENVLNVFRASLIVNYPNEFQNLENKEWDVARKLASIHNIKK